MGSDKKVYGKYTVMRTTQDPMRDEWTNIGVIVFDPDGNQIYARMGFERALARGDISEQVAGYSTERYKAYEHIEQVERALESQGHMMSSIQIRAPLPCMMRESYDDLFELFVVGRKK